MKYVCTGGTPARVSFLALQTDERLHQDTRADLVDAQSHDHRTLVSSKARNHGLVHGRPRCVSFPSNADFWPVQGQALTLR